MSNRGQNLPFTPFVLWLAPYRLLCLCSFVPGFILSPVYLLKTSLTLCKLFARNFHFKRLYCLNQYFLYLGGYLLTTGQIYGFSGTLLTVCSLSHINGKTPALFPGLIAYCLCLFRTSHLSNENNVAFHGGCCIPFPLSFLLLPNIPGRAFHLPEIPG